MNRAWMLAAALVSVALAGCASLPEAGANVTVAVSRVLAAADLKPVESERLKAAGIGAADIASGRVARVHCAVMTDGWWDAIAVLPDGSPGAGAVFRMNVV